MDVDGLNIDICRVEDAEMDEMWSFVGSKKQQRWLWHAIDHATGAVLAIERKHLTLRTRIKRLARKSICFSKSILMHDIVIGLFINRFEFPILSS